MKNAAPQILAAASLALAAVTSLGCAHAYSAQATGVTPPELIGSCAGTQPVLPDAARSQGLSGLVLVNYVVGADGHVKDVQLADRRASPLFFDAARSWLTSCQFKPGTRDGQPVNVTLREVYSFRAPTPDVASAQIAMPASFTGQVTQPIPGKCIPAAPIANTKAGGEVKVEFTVYQNGRVAGINEVSEKPRPDLFKMVQVWLESCPFQPGRTPDGKLAAVKLTQTYVFESSRR